MWGALSQSEELGDLLEQAREGHDPAALGSLQEEIEARRDDMERLRAVIERSRVDLSRK